ncbi:glutamine synthetase family protein [Streptomyces canus]|uniref:glutamine synthetase family protein n=1 Tax=Streptomyces canus TaxID=58343 RepID=UPI0038658C65|nr:glutamine synthetase family protein [Streptomyces canus]
MSHSQHHAAATGLAQQEDGGFEDLRHLVERGAVTSVLLAVPDMQGRLKGKRYDAAHFLASVATGGADMCAYVFATDVGMRPLDGFALASFDTGYGDMGLLPDPGSVYQLAWMPRTALVLADAIGHDGQPVAVAPRQILWQQLARLASRGITAQVGLETEFVLCHQEYADVAETGSIEIEPVDTENRDYSLDYPRVMDRFLTDLQECLAGAGRPIEAIKLESAPGQVEITFPYGDPMAAADTHLLLKHAARTIGEQSCLVPTFMAAPATGVGSGFHIHLSFVHDGAPRFAETGGRMPDAARHVIAGLLDVLPHLAVLYAPTVNSYKRFVPGSFAPVNFTWGRDNRTCAIRVVGRGDNLHLEIRLPGADANPYLALAAVLAAAQHGLDHKLDPPHPCVGNAFAETGAPPVPGSLEEALAALDSSPLPASDLLTPAGVEHYTNAARHEIATHRTTVTDLELRRGFATA